MIDQAVVKDLPSVWFHLLHTCTHDCWGSLCTASCPYLKTKSREWGNFKKKQRRNKTITKTIKYLVIHVLLFFFFFFIDNVEVPIPHDNDTVHVSRLHEEFYYCHSYGVF